MPTPPSTAPFRDRGPSRPRHRTALAALALTALLAGGCSAGADQSPNGPGVLAVGTGFTPDSLDPARINTAFTWYVDPAYDPLIYLAPDGSLHPRLALSWRYVGSGNRVFEIRLRPHVRFSDGTPLTADVVKRNIAYFRGAGGGAAPYLAPVTSVDVIDPLTVRLTLSRPDPLLAQVFTQDHQAGDVISATALDRPGRLATRTFGAGPYVLDAAATVADDHYTYVPNPGYWNRAAVPRHKLVIKVLPNADTALAALRTGQVDAVQGDQTTVDAARTAGLNIADAPHVVWGLALADRAGTLSTPLGDVLVRQALNYAVDRRAITKASSAATAPPPNSSCPPARTDPTPTTATPTTRPGPVTRTASPCRSSSAPTAA
ncbi:ABC transporter substrate-binding protein [Streptantibioticus cattleyicolor]|uniref:Putative ABC transporter solute binding component n=1 Tax=Streptantibioticus cattleyicolor (strain ATCC 35852 / DSM 46488 / JCM 4925 / NBRC 14057 / NRRL 8057) TaxID=1003195 RepID=F8JK28_STREN|nr:ABC transporter substrate-binding protein [Streptantibioticus cattleyicolor]AEW99837.1 putative ABC transporter solute binding component [Streptantibioticus cattleyicolor NRRL 8057 = DSM 46488]CCB71127.1 exported protein of unknown function [Streptantibioticus cattleyicolor NRRL 8057 = DSM 46488]